MHLPFRAGCIWIVSTLVGIPLVVPAIAQEGGRYSLTGDIQSRVRLERRSESETPDTDTLEVRQGYNLTITGPIHDARLASFSVTGSLSLDDMQVDPGPDRSLRLLSLFSSVSLLSATRFPLGLRFSWVDGKGDESKTTGMSYGATWNASFKDLPSLQLSCDRGETQSEHPSGKRTLTGTSARMRLSKRYTRSSFDLEYERRDTSDNRGLDVVWDHGRFSSYHRLSPGLNLSTSALVDREDRDGTFGAGESLNLALSSSVSYLPDPDLSATGAAHFSRSEIGDSFLQNQGVNAHARRRFHLSPELEANTSASASLTQTASSYLGGEVFWSSGLGGDLVSRQIRPIRVGVGYHLHLSNGATSSAAPGGFAAVTGDPGALQTTQRMKLNLTSRTLDPYTMSGDYSFIIEQGALNRQTHTAQAQVTGSPIPNLTFRGLLRGSLADNPDVTAVFGDVSATYAPRFDLSLTSGVLASWVEADEQSTFITRIPLILRYQPERLTTMSLEGFWERITNSTLTPNRSTYEARLRIERPFRRVRLALEFRFRDSEAADGQRQEAEIMVTVSRPFSYGF